MFAMISYLTASASVISEVDIVNLLAALFASIVEVLANSDTTAVVFALTGV